MAAREIIGPPLGALKINWDSPQAAGLLSVFSPPLWPGISRLPDATGRGADGTLINSPAWAVSGELGHALQYNGSNTYVSIANTSANAMLADGSFTLCVWASSTYTGSNRNMLRRDNYLDLGTEYRRVVGIGYNGAPSLYLHYNTSFAVALSPTSIADGAPHLVVGVRDTAAGQIRIYVDGLLMASSSEALGANVNTARQPWVIGSFSPINVTETWSGMIGEVRFYNHALPAELIYQMWAPETRWGLYRGLTTYKNKPLFATAEISDISGAGDSSTAFIESQNGFEEQAGAGDSAYAAIEKWLSAFAGSAAAGDIVDAFNLGNWVNLNQARAVLRFYFTLTGAEDGANDIVIPISSFQCRMATTSRTYVAVVIPGLDYAGDIADRINGKLLVDLAWYVDGVESLKEEFCRADFDRIDIAEGVSNKSIILHGYQDLIIAPKSVNVTNIMSRMEYDGKKRYQVATPDLYLRPGDTAIIGGESIVVDSLTYAFSVAGSYMYIAESGA